MGLKVRNLSKTGEGEKPTAGAGCWEGGELPAAELSVAVLEEAWAGGSWCGGQGCPPDRRLAGSTRWEVVWGRHARAGKPLLGQ